MNIMNQSKKDVLKLLFLILFFLILMTILIFILFRSGLRLVTICVLIVFEILLFIKFGRQPQGIERIGACHGRIAVSTLSALVFIVYSLAIFKIPLRWFSWLVILISLVLLIILLLVLTARNKNLEINRYYNIKSVVLSAICFGLLPIMLYFSSFCTLENNYIYEEYFSYAEEVQAVLRDVPLLSELDTEIFDISNKKNLSSSIMGNKSTFIDVCMENDSLMKACAKYLIHPEDIYNYYVEYSDVCNRFDMSFVVFGYSTGILIFCLYHYYVNKNRKQVMAFGLCLALFTFFSTTAEGAVIYWVLTNINLPNHSTSVNVTQVNIIYEMLRGFVVAFSVLIAVDRVYRKDTPINIVGSEEDQHTMSKRKKHRRMGATPSKRKRARRRRIKPNINTTVTQDEPLRSSTI